MFTSTARVCAVHPMTSHQIIHSKSLYCRVGFLELHQLGPQSTPRLHRLDSWLTQEPYGWVSLFLHLPGEGLILTKVCLPHSLTRSFTLPSLPSLSLSYLFSSTPLPIRCPADCKLRMHWSTPEHMPGRMSETISE